jgi:mRNA-degrading endonuclease RelE of RelBE toxin-antitoxin system
MEEIEDWEDNLLLARAKASDTGERIPMEEVFNRIETARKEVLSNSCGSFRVIYDIFDQQLIITIIAIGHRKDIYC